MPVEHPFHPLVAQWFADRFREPTAPQTAGWREIASGRHTLIAAPTGSGKTLAAFLWAINRLVQRHLAGALPDATQVVYVSPLKALGNDIERNLREPLRGIQDGALEQGLDPPDIRVAVRSGDTPSADRARMLRRPPHILITTPESLYILLTAEGSRRYLSTAETVIVDEIHAVAGDKRGAHLALSLERLDALAGGPLQRIGLSATQKPIEEIARLLVGAQGDCAIVDVGHRRPMELSVMVPDIELGPIATHEVWAAAYEHIVEQIKSHRATLVFVSTRRQAERVAYQLGERLGHDRVAAHHGSLSRDTRLAAERRLKGGEVPVVVATASLELGIDIGYVDLVCHVGAPRSIATLLQRIGRSGHWLGAIPKGILYPLTRDELLQTAAGIRAVQAGDLDRVAVVEKPLDILAQQIVAIAASGRPEGPRPGEGPAHSQGSALAPDASERSVPLSQGERGIGEDELFGLIQRAYPYRDLPRKDFDQVLDMLSEGIATGRGRRSAYLHRDWVYRVLRGRRGARLAAITSGGAIPDVADYDVVEEPAGTLVGRVHEDFAMESMAGDIFLLGNQSWRIRRVESGKVRVEDAHGAPPTIPFWVGEAPARTAELSTAVSDLREEVATRLGYFQGRGAGEETWDAGRRAPLPVGEAARAGPAANGGSAVAGPLWVQALLAGGPRTGEGWPTGGSSASPDPNPLPEGEGISGAAPLEALAGLGSPIGRAAAAQWLQREASLDRNGAEQLVDYVAATVAVLGAVPTQQTVVAERFFDEAGGMQLVIHAPFGGRINRAWGLALRKRFCVTFDFELQAAATDDGIVISLGEQHSFPLSSVFSMVRPLTLQQDLIQAALASPMFINRWRWNAGRSLAILRHAGGRRVPMYLQRMRAEDLLAAVFPGQAQCQDNRVGPILPPDHPLVNETIENCLHEAMDVDGLRAVLEAIERGEIRTLAVETPAPSPMSHEILNANPYAFLDDAPLEERRARAVSLRRTDPDLATGIGALDPEAIAVVRSQAWPDVRDAEDLHDVLMTLILLPLEDSSPWREFAAELVRTQRAAVATWPGQRALVAAERVQALRAIVGDLALDPPLSPPTGVPTFAENDALRTAVHGWLEALGPTTATELAYRLGLPVGDIEIALAELEGRGAVLRGRFTSPHPRGEGIVEASPHPGRELAQRPPLPGGEGASPAPLPLGEVARAGPAAKEGSAVAGPLWVQALLAPGPRTGEGGNPDDTEWCERRLLARIHRLTLARLRQEIEPVSAADLLRFLFHWQHLAPGTQLHGRDGLMTVVRQLQGIELPAPAWESWVFPGRTAAYEPSDLEQLCLAGVVAWGRISHRLWEAEDEEHTGSHPSPFLGSGGDGGRAPSGGPTAARRGRRTGPGRQAPLAFILREDLPWLLSDRPDPALLRPPLSADASAVVEFLDRRGASFLTEIARGTGRVPAVVEDALWELVARGLVTGDGIAGLRVLLEPEHRRVRQRRHLRSIPGGRATRQMAMGRWALWHSSEEVDPDERTERSARQLLRRYGVVFRELLAREAQAPPWRTLLAIYRRLEARGEIRGGRYVNGFVGEQFALAEAVDALRGVRRAQGDGELVLVHTGDPLNLVGILTPGARLSPYSNQMVAFRDGVPVDSGPLGAVRSRLQIPQTR